MDSASHSTSFNLKLSACSMYNVLSILFFFALILLYFGQSNINSASSLTCRFLWLADPFNSVSMGDYAHAHQQFKNYNYSIPSGRLQCLGYSSWRQISFLISSNDYLFVLFHIVRWWYFQPKIISRQATNNSFREINRLVFRYTSTTCVVQTSWWFTLSRYHFWYLDVVYLFYSTPFDDSTSSHRLYPAKLPIIAFAR